MHFKSNVNVFEKNDIIFFVIYIQNKLLFKIQNSN
jgi:hypothetical protein